MSMDLDEQTKNEAAKWRALRAAILADVAKYEKQRSDWLMLHGEEKIAEAERHMNATARHVTGYLSLALGVAS